jgi:hypothetical protein
MDRLDRLVDKWFTVSGAGKRKDALPYIGDPQPGDMEIIEVRRAKSNATLSGRLSLSAVPKVKTSPTCKILCPQMRLARQ